MSYESIFQERGGSYHAAMRRWPEARREDFTVPLAWLDPRPGERVLDVPAGGGYLQHFLPAGCHWAGHEPCASFTAGALVDRPLLPLPWPEAFAPAAISIAGIHHLEDKRALLAEFRRVLAPGGRLLIADVHVDSAVAGFLDGFVGRHNSTGHRGIYLDDAFLGHVAAGDFRIVRAARERFHWWFDDEAAMSAFCRALFDLREIGDDEIATAIERLLGTTREAGRIGMRWELQLVLAQVATR